MEIVNASRRPTLRRLDVRSSDFVQHPEAEALTRTVASSFLWITHLHLSFLLNSRNVEVGIQAKNLRPLFECKLITELHLYHNLPVDLDDCDVAKMGQAWPHMRSLGLCPDPEVSLPNIRGPSITILSTIARHFPDLLKLYIYVNSDGVPAAYHSPFDFKQLEVCSFGTSEIPEPNDARIPAYLSGVLTIGTVIKSERSPTRVLLVQERPITLLRNESKAAYWSATATTVAILQEGRKASIEEKRRIIEEKHALERKVKALEALLRGQVSSHGQV